MATPDRDNLYNEDGNRTIYTRESNGTGWFVGIIVALALLAIGYLIFSANSGPTTDVGAGAGAPALEEPAAPAGGDVAPMTGAPAVDPAAPADAGAAPAGDAAAPAGDTAAPAGDAAAPADAGAAAPLEEPVQ